MRCEYYNGERKALIEWCCDASVLQKYLEDTATECEQLADLSLLRHLRQLQQIAQTLSMNGRADLEKEQRGALDALFSDMIAFGTYNVWDMPLEADGQGDLPLDVQVRGLLGADECLNAAMLFVIDEGRIAICRNREADLEARHPHDKSH